MLSNRCKTLAVSCLALSALFASQVTSDESKNEINTQAGTPPGPQEAANLFTVPDGFRLSLFAGEPDIQQPIAMTTDERGRLWVAENYTYAEHPANFNTELKDRLVILEDADGDGRFDRRKVFWDQGRKLTSVEVGHGGVWVLCAPQLLFIPDRDRDDVPDGPPEVILDGWDEGVVRHNIVNGLKWGPDGWLYGRHGIQATSQVGKPGAAPSQRTKLNCSIWRYHPIREDFEVVCQGTTNSWGFDYDDHGQMFFINTVIGHLWHVIPGAHYRRMYGADFNPHVYQLIEQCADHFHWDTGEKWSDIRSGASDTTSQAGGGHAHSGLMIYLGDNWPDRYRNSVFTLNFHGRRINNDVLVRENAGYTARHAEDLVFANNEWFRGIELIYGPDGGVYIADWSDIGECHENNGVHRTSGRIYKVYYGEPKKPSPIDLAALNNEELVKLQLSQNDWHARQSRRILHERATSGQDMADARLSLLELYENQSDATRKLRALWCLNLIGAIDESWLREQLAHENEHIRLWAIRLLVDQQEVSQATIGQFVEMATKEDSGIVRLYLASALQRVPLADRWPIVEGLVSHSEDASDRSLPSMIWYGLEPAVPIDPERAVAVAENSLIPLVRRNVARRLTSELESYAPAVNRLLLLAVERDDSEFQRDVLQGMNEALRGWRKAPPPESWSSVSAVFANSPSIEVQEHARQLGILFGDGRAVEELKEIISNTEADAESRRSALRTLVQDRSPAVLELLKTVLTDHALVNEAVRGFAEFDDATIPGLLIGCFGSLDPAGRAAAIDTLVSRASYAQPLLAAVKSGLIEPAMISAFHARQVRSFNDESLNRDLEEFWGAVRDTSEKKRSRIDELKTLLTSERIAGGNASCGRLLFEKTCNNCHVLYGKGLVVGPDLTGSNRHNLAYLLENIVDPSASVSKEFRVSAIVLNDGRVVTGVVVEQNDRTLTVQTEKESRAISQEDVDEVVLQETSLMPDGLLQQFNKKQIVDLFAYLSTRSQVPISAAP